MPSLDVTMWTGPLEFTNENVVPNVSTSGTFTIGALTTSGTGYIWIDSQGWRISGTMPDLEFFVREIPEFVPPRAAWVMLCTLCHSARVEDGIVCPDCLSKYGHKDGGSNALDMNE